MLVECYRVSSPFHPSPSPSLPYIFLMSNPAGNQDPSSPQLKARQRAGPPRTRAKVRTSLACVPCRSKHSKCDGDVPACIRCRLENKVCSYAKSRRGARLRKTRDETTFSLPSDTSASPDSTTLDSGLKVTKTLPGGWTSGPAPHPSQCQNYLLDQYYLYFHDSHSWLPPKTTMRRLIESRPDEVRFTTTVIAYIGSVYSNNVETDPLRRRAFQMASGPLSNSIWDVQALLSLSIAACGEGHVDLCGSFFNTALEIALGLGLQNKSFASAEEDPVLAESYRRTYWALYFHGSVRTVREHLGYFQLFSTSVTTELPCDEWDYQTGVSAAACFFYTALVNALLAYPDTRFPSGVRTKSASRNLFIMDLPYWPDANQWRKCSSNPQRRV